MHHDPPDAGALYVAVCACAMRGLTRDPLQPAALHASSPPPPSAGRTRQSLLLLQPWSRVLSPRVVVRMSWFGLMSLRTLLPTGEAVPALRKTRAHVHTRTCIHTPVTHALIRHPNTGVLWQSANSNKTNFFSKDFDATAAAAAKLRPGDAGYGTAPEGSLSAARAAKGKQWVNGQILLLLQVIKRMDGGGAATPSVRFIDLFTEYTKISDTLVGMLMRAKKRGLVKYKGEMLLQRYHDDVVISLTEKGIARLARAAAQS